MTFKTCSQSEELYEDSYEDEDADTKSLLSNMTNGWEKKALEEINLGMSLQEIIK